MTPFITKTTKLSSVCNLNDFVRILALSEILTKSFQMTCIERLKSELSEIGTAKSLDFGVRLLYSGQFHKKLPL